MIAALGSEVTWNIRDVLLAVFAFGWLAVLVITAIRGPIPAELWAVLGFGVGGILAAFRADDRIGRSKSSDSAHAKVDKGE